LGLEINATLFAQIIDLLIFILFFAGIVILVSKAWAFKKDIQNKVEIMDGEIKEMRRLLEGKKR